MTFAVSPGSVTLAMVQTRTVMEKMVAAFASSPAAVGFAEVLKTVSNRYPLIVAPARSPVAATFARMMSREPRDVPLLGLAVSPPQQSLIMVLHRGAPGKAILALGTSPSSLSIAQVLKGAAMPPEMVMGLVLIEAFHTSLSLRWLQPGLGTGILLNYEYRINGGPAVSTMSPGCGLHDSRIDAGHPI